MPVVDSHVHILPDEFRSGRDHFLKSDATFRALFNDPKAKTASAEDLIREMDEAGVNASVALGYGWTDPAAARAANDYALESARRYPGRIIPFCSVNPLWGADAVAELERCAGNGARGVGELHPDSQGYADADMASLAPLIDAASAHGMPVLMHASEPVGHGYPGKGTVTPDMLMTLVRAFPRATFIFAHFGGGLPFYSLMPEVRRSLANVYFDSAAYPLLYEDSVFEVSTTSAGADRVLFGSDFPLVSQARALKGLHQAGLSAEAADAVLGGNAVRLFGEPRGR